VTDPHRTSRNASASNEREKAVAGSSCFQVRETILKPTTLSDGSVARCRQEVVPEDGTSEGGKHSAQSVQ
jgi:hypothetical protein